MAKRTRGKSGESSDDVVGSRSKRSVASGTQAILSVPASLISKVFSCSFGDGRSDPACGMASGLREGPTSSFVKGLWVSPSLQSPHPYKGDGCAAFVACGVEETLGSSRGDLEVESDGDWDRHKEGRRSVVDASGPSPVGVRSRRRHEDRRHRGAHTTPSRRPGRGGFAHQASCRGR